MAVEQMALVLNHSAAKGTDKLVLIGIANHAGDGGSWPSIETLARYAGVSERSVQRSIRRLVNMGELTVRYNAGSNSGGASNRRPNCYTLRPRGDTVSPQDVPGVTPVSPQESVRGDTGDATGVTLASPEPSLREQVLKRLTPLSPSETSPQGERSPGSGAFEAFWENYPRKAGKQAARKAFAKCIQSGGESDAIIAGAANYRDDPNRVNEFTAHPATWLNRGSWDDDPLPARHNPGRKSGGQIYTELAAGHQFAEISS